VIQMLKQITSQKLRPKRLPQFWQVRYYDFPVWTEAKRIEKLRYIHRNPVKRASAVTQKRPMRVTSKPANENEARGR
jgi:putative transposase